MTVLTMMTVMTMITMMTLTTMMIPSPLVMMGLIVPNCRAGREEEGCKMSPHRFIYLHIYCKTNFLFKILFVISKYHHTGSFTCNTFTHLLHYVSKQNVPDLKINLFLFYINAFYK